MTLKKMKSKSHKSTVKRVKFTNGGNIVEGKMITNRRNKQHRMIKKSRSRVLKGKKGTVLSEVHNKMRSLVK